MANLKTGDVIIFFDLEGEDAKIIHDLCAQIGIPVPETITKRQKPCYTADYILKNDRQNKVLHVRRYSGFKTKPTLINFKNDDHMAIGHMPLEKNAYDGDVFQMEIIGNVTPDEEDLDGYYEYFKMTDFDEYLRLTGKDYDEEIRKSNKYTDLGSAAFEQGDYGEARHYYDMALNLYPSAYTYNNLGRVALAMEDFMGAESLFETALDLIEPISFALDQFYRDLGHAQYGAGRSYRAAKANFQYALDNRKSLSDEEVNEINDIIKDMDGYNLKSAKKFKRGDVIIAEDPDNENTKTMYELYQNTDDTAPFDYPDKDDVYYSVYHVLDTDEDYIHCQLYAGFKEKPALNNFQKDAFLYMEHTPFEHTEFYEIKIDGNVSIPEKHFEAYHYFLKINNFDSYVEKTGKTVKAESNKAIDLYQEGLDLQKKGKAQKALEKYQEAIDIYPSEIVYHDAAGWMLLELKEYEKAIEDTDFALRYASEDDETTYSLYAILGYAHYYLEEDHTAVDYFNMALENTNGMHAETVKEIENILDDIG